MTTPEKKYVTAGEIEAHAFDVEFGKIHTKVVEMLKSNPSEGAVIRTMPSDGSAGELSFCFKFKEHCISKWTQLEFTAEMKFYDYDGFPNYMLTVKL